MQHACELKQQVWRLTIRGFPVEVRNVRSATLRHAAYPRFPVIPAGAPLAL